MRNWTLVDTENYVKLFIASKWSVRWSYMGDDESEGRTVSYLNHSGKHEKIHVLLRTPLK